MCRHISTEGLVTQCFRCSIGYLQGIRTTELLLYVGHDTHLRTAVGLEADGHLRTVGLIELVALTGNEIENILGSSVRVVQLNTRGRTELWLQYGRRLADMYVADERFFLKLLDLGCVREAIPHEQFLITHGG